VAVLRFPGLDLAEWAWAELPTDFPYIPGLLSFREIPVILAAMERLTLAPDLVLVDGQGIAHPRRIGIASHLGVLLDLPTIGAAKSRLVGRYDEPGPERGDRSPLVHRGEVVGAVLRTRSRVGPLFVSAGHRVSLDTAVGYTLACAPKYRLPETTRQAHNLAARAKAEARQSQFPLPGLPEKG
jgi:deoxyribonuclease V